MAKPKSNKLPFVVGTGTIISIAGIIIGVATPELRCGIGFSSESCPAKDQLADVQLLIQTEERQPIDMVKVLFIPNKGAPETKYTNSDGYVQTKIPSTGDIEIQLSKTGFQSLSRTINLGIEPDKNKTYILTKANSSDSQTSSFSSPTASVSNPSTTASSQPNSNPSSSPELSLNNQSPLFESNCESATPGRSLNEILITPSNASVPLGREVLPLLAYMTGTYNAVINKSRPIEFVCNLNSSFKELKLVFGVHGGNDWARPENKLLFGVYLDGNLAGTKEVIVGSKQELALNLQGVKNVSLRAECKSDNCPALCFTEMSLK